MIKNYIQTARQNLMASHDGEGPYGLYEVWQKEDFKSNCDFIDRLTIPANSKIGYHRHGNNEEMYIILSGEGNMKLGDDEYRVKKGDMILNPAFGAHGLENDSNDEIDILVIQLSMN